MQFYLKLQIQSPLEQKICPKEPITPENKVFLKAMVKCLGKTLQILKPGF